MFFSTYRHNHLQIHWTFKLEILYKAKIHNDMSPFCPGAFVRGVEPQVQYLTLMRFHHQLMTRQLVSQPTHPQLPKRRNDKGRWKQSLQFPFRPYWTLVYGEPLRGGRLIGSVRCHAPDAQVGWDGNKWFMGKSWKLGKSLPINWCRILPINDITSLP